MTEICPPWWDHFEKELSKTQPDFGRYCAMLTTTELETRKKYVTFQNILVEKFGIEKDFVRANAPLNAVRPLLKFDLKSEIGSKAMDIIVKTLKNNKSIRKEHINLIIGYKKDIQLKNAINPSTIKLKANPKISLTNAPTNERKELNAQFIKLAGKSIGVYQELAKRNELEDEYAAFVAGVIIIQKYLNYGVEKE